MDSTAENVLAGFFRKLESLGSGLLLLDYDGTLAPFCENRLKAYPAEGIREQIDAILALPTTRVVLVTGRHTGEVLELLGLRHPLEVWGCHGREHRLPNGEIRYHGVTPENSAALREARDRLREANLVEPFRLDAKTGCLAIHWRGEEHRAEEIERRAREIWRPFVETSELEIENFNGGVELSVPGRTKGDAVNTLLEGIDPTQTAVAFLGDDLTDENGFRALGPRGLSVLVGSEREETAADLRISMPEGVRNFLRQWHESLERSHA